MDVGRSFKAMTEDPAWVTKLALAFLFEILVVTAPAVIGYFMAYGREVAHGRDSVLPEWSGFGSYWVSGLLVILSALVYVVVGLILLIIGIIPAMILFQGAVVEYAMTGEPGALFRIGTVWKRITTNSSFWLALAVGIGLGVAINIVSRVFQQFDSTAVTAVGGLVTAALGLYVQTVQWHLYGQYASVAYGLRPAGFTPGQPGYTPPPPPAGYPPPPPTPQGYAPPPPPGTPGPGGYAPPPPPAPQGYAPPPPPAPQGYSPPPPPAQPPAPPAADPPAAPEPPAPAAAPAPPAEPASQVPPAPPPGREGE